MKNKIKNTEMEYIAKAKCGVVFYSNPTDLICADLPKYSCPGSLNLYETAALQQKPLFRSLNITKCFTSAGSVNIFIYKNKLN